MKLKIIIKNSIILICCLIAVLTVIPLIVGVFVPMGIEGDDFDDTFLGKMLNALE